jgi:hypothetical protein
VLEKDVNGNVTGQTVITSAEDLAAHMATYSNYDSFLGINVVDEPKGANDWATETNKKIEDTNYLRYNYYRDLAKAILPYTNITSYINMHGSQAVDKGTYSTYVNEIAKDVDVLSFDTYLYFEDQTYPILTRRRLSSYLESLDTIRQVGLEQGKPFWLRYVLVPGVSDFEEDIRALAEHFKDYKMLQRLEILPYHTLGVHKYESMGQEYALKGVPTNTPAQLERARALFEEYFSCVVLN